MKKIICVLLLCLICLPVFANQWKMLFENVSLDFDNITANKKTNIVSLWVKRQNTDKTLVFDNKEINYAISNIEISCRNKESRTGTIAFYDKENKLIEQSDSASAWSAIVPDTYSDAYYRMFCLVKFKDNPLITKVY